MAWRTSLGFITRIALLAVLFIIIMSVASLAVGLADTGQQTNQAIELLSLFGVGCLFSIAVSYPIIRSRWSGWPLVLTIAVVLFGIMTFLSQIETVVFLKYLVDIVPTEAIPRLFLQGAIVAVLFSPLAVLVHGRMKQKELYLMEINTRLNMPVVQWVWKLALLAVIYIFIYIGFGIFFFLPLGGGPPTVSLTRAAPPPWGGGGFGWGGGGFCLGGGRGCGGGGGGLFCVFGGGWWGGGPAGSGVGAWSNPPPQFLLEEISHFLFFLGFVLGFGFGGGGGPGGR